MDKRSLAYHELQNSARRLADALGHEPQFIAKLGGFQFHNREQGWTITVVVDVESLARAEEDPYTPITYNAAGFVHDHELGTCVDRHYATTDLKEHTSIVKGRKLTRPPGIERLIRNWATVYNNRATEPERKVYVNDDAIQYQAATPNMDYDGPLFLNMAEPDVTTL